MGILVPYIDWTMVWGYFQELIVHLGLFRRESQKINLLEGL